MQKRQQIPLNTTLWSYQDQDGRDICNTKNRLPIRFQPLLFSVDYTVFLPLRLGGKSFFKLSCEALRREVESDGNDAEKTEAGYLNCNADLSYRFSRLRFVLSIRSIDIDSRGFDSANKLEKQRNYIADDEDGCNKARRNPE